MIYRVMDGYIQKLNKDDLWQNIARAVDVEDCMILAERGNATARIEEAMDVYLAQVVKIEGRFSRKGDKS